MSKPKKRRKPWWMRMRLSCPDCGKIVEEYDAPTNTRKDIVGIRIKPKPFDCPRCKAHYSATEFWSEQSEKWKCGRTLV